MKYLFLVLLAMPIAISCKGPAGTMRSAAGDSLQIIKPGGGSELLFQNKWMLTRVGQQDVNNLDTSRVPYLLFFPGQVNRVNGYNGCNRLNGTFEIGNSNSIRFGPMASTKMHCPETGGLAPAITVALGNVTHFHATRKELTLLQNGRVEAVFTAK